MPVEPGGGIGDGATPPSVKPPFDKPPSDKPEPKVSNPPRQERASDLADRAVRQRTIPRAIHGKWRQTDGPSPSAADCDGTAAGNMGKVMEVREDGYSIFEEGGRLERVIERSDGKVRAVFDTTYADTPTSDELTFAVDPVARTLTVTTHGNANGSPTTYKRCPG